MQRRCKRGARRYCRSQAFTESRDMESELAETSVLFFQTLAFLAPRATSFNFLLGPLIATGLVATLAKLEHRSANKPNTCLWYLAGCFPHWR